MRCLGDRYRVVEPFIDKDGSIDFACIADSYVAPIQVMTSEDVAKLLKRTKADVDKEVADELSSYPWLSKRIWLPLEPDFEASDSRLLDDIEQYLRTHVEFSNETDYKMAACWVICTFFQEMLDVAPRLILYGPTRSGKTRALTTLMSLSYRAMDFVYPSGPAVFRTIERYRPTVFIDEAHILTDPRKSDFGQIFSGGFDNGKKIIRAHKDDGGTDTYNVFSMITIATKKLPPEDWQNRSILVNMQERTSSEIARRINYDEAARLRGRLLALRVRVLAGLIDVEGAKSEAISAAESYPVVCGVDCCLDDRAIDLASSLMIPATMFGGVQDVLRGIRESAREAKQELMETTEASVFCALQGVISGLGGLDDDGNVIVDVAGISTREIQAKLSEDLSEGGESVWDVSTRSVTNAVRTLGFKVRRGAANKSYLVPGQSFDKAWATATRKYGARGAQS